jgi:pimeloyl-ACP methyl ester carboxylesterase
VSGGRRAGATTLQRDDETIAFDDPGGPGPLVLCAHNLLLDRLAGRARVVAVDLRGHGESSARRPFGVPELARDLLVLLDRLEAPRAVLVGVSLGAAAAAELALLAPGRVAGLLLAAPNLDTASPRDAAELTGLGLLVRGLGWRPGLRARALGALFGPGFRARSPAALEAWGARLAAPGPLASWRALRAWVGRPPLRERAPDLPRPLLAAIGSDDAAAPRSHSEDLAALPRARLLLVPDAGHSLQVEAPDTLARGVEALLDEAGEAARGAR